MISMINGLQIILHLPIMMISWPGPIMNFYQIILPFVMFDVIESFDWINDPFQATFQWQDGDLDDLNIFDQVQNLGYDSHNPMLNLGTMSLCIMAYTVRLLILLTIVYPNRRKKCCKGCFKSLKESLLFGEILTIFVEAHIELCLAGTIMTQISATGQNQDNNPVMWTLGISFLLVSYGLMPGLFLWLLCQKKTRYAKQVFQRKWGILLEGVNLHSKWHVAFFFVFILRRIFYVLCYTLLDGYPAIQIQLISGANLAQLMYQGYHYPLVGHLKNRIETMNEMFVISCGMFLFLYSNYLSDRRLQARISMLNVGVICLMLAVNMGFVFYFSGRSMYFVMY